MNIEYLREFVVLAEIGNFLEAADRLHLSQSTLSKHIKNIETELGVLLFDRTTRKVALSKYGQILLPYARQIADIQEKYGAVMQRSLDTNREILTVGSIHVLAQYNITDIIADFKKGRPQSTINVVQGGSDEMKEMLRQKKCDLAFIRYADEVDNDFVRIPYAVDTMVAVLPTNHPLAGQTTIPLQMLADEDILLTAKQTMLYKLSIGACEKSGFQPKIAYTDHNVGDLCELVSKGMGVALLMKRIALNIPNPKIAIVDISPRVSTQIGLCYLKGVKLSDAAKHFVKCTESASTKNIKKDNQEQHFQQASKE